MIWFVVLGEWLTAAPIMRDLEAMALRGHKVTCIIAAIPSMRRIEHQKMELDVVRLPRYLPLVSYVWFCMAALKRLMGRYRHVDVLVFGTDMFPLALPWFFLGKKRRPRLVLRETGQVTPPGVRGYYNRILRQFSLYLSQWSDGVFAISPMRASELASKFRIPVSKMHVWPTSVDTNLFSERNPTLDRQRMRKLLGVDDKFLLMYHGALEEDRGVKELLEAIRVLHEERDDVALLFLGKGRAKQGLASYAEDHGLDRTVIFRDSVAFEAVPKFISASDAGIVPIPNLPHYRYQVPTKLLEYLAMGKPVIATDIIGHRWVANDSKVVFFCGNGHHAKIADAIAKCIRARDTTKTEAQSQIAGRFGPDAIADRVLSILANLVAAGESRKNG